jgi:NifU-like protein involved in Fe-S cluster formation
MSDYIDAGLRRRRRPSLPLAGQTRTDEEGRFARFTLALESDATGEEVIADVTFESSSCVTLVAYCELLCGRIEGLTVAAAIRSLLPHALADQLPLVPAAKRPRALLAAQALAAALITVFQEIHA